MWRVQRVTAAADGGAAQTPLGVGSSAGSCGALFGALSSFNMPQGL